MNPNLHRTIVISLALVSLMMAWVWMAIISRSDPWYRNTNMNIHNMVDALSINADVSPNGIDEPGLTLKCLLALDYRVRHYTGQLAVWNVRKFGASKNPLKEISSLIHVGRIHSRIQVLIVILCAAWLTYSITHKIDDACLTVILLCSSSGLLFHGLLTRPELLCVGLGGVLGLACVWRSAVTPHWFKNQIWLFLAGLCVGLSALTKFPGMFYLVPCYMWCWVTAITGPKRTDVPPQASFWSGLLPALAGASILWLLFTITQHHPDLDPIAFRRLRGAAIFVAGVPLLALFNARNRLGSFLLDRMRELALLVAGFLIAIPLSYLLLRGVLTEPHASDYLAGTLHVLVKPQSNLLFLLAKNPEVGREFPNFLKETPLLFLGAVAAVVSVYLVGAIPRLIKLFILLLLITALGMTALMSELSFAAQYSIFPQVPLFLVISLSIAALFGTWRHKPQQTEGSHWAFPVVLTAVFVLMLTVYFRLQPKYNSYQGDADLPVHEPTLTFLFDHDVHTREYLHAMKDHYGDRGNFAKVLQQYLADPANRY